MVKTIYLSGDHAGFNIKEKIKLFLKKLNYNIIDLGPYEYNKNDDYPDFVIPMIKEMKKSKDSLGIVFAGSGQGEAILSNKFKGIRASVYYGKNPKIPKLAREHNDSNILCIGAFFVKEAEAKKAIKDFLNSNFSKGRHESRLKKFENLGVN